MQYKTTVKKNTNVRVLDVSDIYLVYGFEEWTNKIDEGFKLIGWTTDPDLNIVLYKPGQFINVLKNTTLYAVWDKELDNFNNQ